MNENENVSELATLIYQKSGLSFLRSLGIAQLVNLAGYRKVERGHWITREEVDIFDRYDLVDACSVCGHCDWDCTESQSFNFCPHCGADMRGEEDEQHPKV